jgi:outer membrane receptor protein involved in Fe transport
MELLRTDQGIENPARTRTALNGQSSQTRGLAYAARQLDETTRLSVIAGTSLNRFRIPVTPGQETGFTAFGDSAFDSRDLRARQWERNWYGVAAVQKTLGDVELQVAGFARSSSIHYVPDTVGETRFNGVASDVYRGSATVGAQADASWRASANHTLRFGMQASREASRFRSQTTVLPLDANGDPQDDPFGLNDRTSRVGWLYGVYLQDEWRISDAVTLNLGLRADQMVQYTVNGQLSPRANLVWKPTETTTVHAGYARTFTPPQQELVQGQTLERFQNTTNAPESLRNDTVRPERAHRFDVGISQKIGPNLTLGVDAYYKDVRDLLDFGQFGSALIFTPFNYREGKVYGVEFSGNWRDERWLFYGNLAISRSTARDIRSARPAVYRLRRGGAECLGRRAGVGQLALWQRAAAGLRQYREAVALCDGEPRRAAGFHRAGQGDLDRAAGCAERLRHRLPAAGRQRDRRRRAAVRDAPRHLRRPQPGLLTVAGGFRAAASGV